MGEPRSFLEHLRHRKLVQWGVAYLAAGWLVLQVLDLLRQTFDWTTTPQQVAAIVLIAGFPVALLLAWYHGEKGAQRVSGPEFVMMVALLVIAGGAIALVGRTPLKAIPRPAQVAEQGSIAVLPFLDMSPKHDQRYFSDGLTEELLNVLAQLPELRVAARTSSFSFRDKKVPVDSLARALHVATVLEGSVRKAGDEVRITAQLIDAKTGFHLWSETYDRKLKDIFAVQDEISRAIVNALEVKLAGGETDGPLVKEETTDPEAHALVLQGEYVSRASTAEALTHGAALFQQAIDRDSTYARAYAGLAKSYLYRAYTHVGPSAPFVHEAKTAAARAVSLDPRLAEAHVVLADIASLHDWDFATAEVEYHRAIELNPGLSRAHSRRGWMLMDLGHPEEALAEARRATQLDPVSVGALSNLGALYAYAGQPERSVETFRSALLLLPGSPITLGNLALAYSLLHRDSAAIATAERARVQAPDLQFVLAVLGYVYGRAGRRAEAESVIQTIEAQPEPGADLLATAYAGLGDRERVFFLLDRAVIERDGSAPDLGVDPVFDPYRADPRMRKLLDRIGLP